LISGTSIDGIDAALVEISDSDRQLAIELIAAETYPYPADLQQQLLAICDGAACSMAEFAALDDRVAAQFAAAALRLQTGHPATELIGSHGQTVFHRPPAGQPNGNGSVALGYSLQIGRGALIAHLTGLPTISNFRAADIAVGGQGAPLVPAVDAVLLRHETIDRCVQNIGGIGNLTYLPAQTSPHPDQVLGWDTGPGNMLLDLAVQHLSQGEKTYDAAGAWAAQGTPCQELINRWLQQEFFHQPPPKSTGREHFGSTYLQYCLADAAERSLSAADTLATLTDLTAASIVHSYQQFLPRLPDQVLLCGGGSKNLCLKQYLQRRLSPATVLTTDEVGLNSDFKEAIAFAVLAYWRWCGIPGNLPTVTGAPARVLLGEIYPVRELSA
jgi:anhydro-N-acetylmuramic acid kinase